MERTQSLVVNPRLAQVNELANHIHDVYGIHDFVYRRSVNHNRLRKYKKVSKPPNFGAANAKKNLFFLSCDMRQKVVLMPKDKYVSRENIAQNVRYVHVLSLFVQFVWLCVRFFVILQRF